MAEQFHESVIANAIGHPVSAAMGALLTWWTAGSTGVAGSALAALFSILGGICGLAFSLIYRRYIRVLGAGAKRKGSLERLAYDKVRESLAEGGSAAVLYARRLTGFLDAVDHFFSDAGMANQTLFPHAFGLRTPAPLWTGPALDRCLILAVVYPVATIFVIWAISGHTGPAEAALHLKPGLTAWQRGLAVALVGFSIFAMWRSGPLRGWKSWKSYAWFATVLAVVVAASSIAGKGAGIVALGFAIAGGSSVTISGHNVLSGAETVASGVVSVVSVIVSPYAIFALGLASFASPVAAALLSAVVGAVVLTIALTGSGAVTVVGAVGFVVTLAVAYAVLATTEIAIKQGWHGVFLALFFPVMILVCLVDAYLLSSLERWETWGPLLLFLGLLTLFNAPFDWGSLGLTRALLRRGLELGGWWPYLLALVDALLAAIIVALLAVAMVIGVQAYNDLAVLGGGAPILPLNPFFDSIAAHPTAPEYWWAYALLFSTMIPSLINLVIGGASLVRWTPGLPSLLLRFMPAGKTVPTFDRAWIALVLTLQVIGGMILGVAVQVLMIVAVIGHVIPLFGLGLLDMARDVAALDLPIWAWQLLGGIP